MEIKQVDINNIKPYGKNAKKHDKTQINNVAESIKQFGMVQPLVIDKDNVVIIGHCRLLACKQLGYNEVPCVCVSELSKEQVDKLRLLDNKLNESDWDIDLLSDEVLGLNFDGFDIDWGINEPLQFEDSDDEESVGTNEVTKKLLMCPVCGHINEEKAFKYYDKDTE